MARINPPSMVPVTRRDIGVSSELAGTDTTGESSHVGDRIGITKSTRPFRHDLPFMSRGMFFAVSSVPRERCVLALEG
jgi:hypothetical protein